jgi:hypothetical protein
MPLVTRQWISGLVLGWVYRGHWAALQVQPLGLGSGGRNPSSGVQAGSPTDTMLLHERDELSLSQVVRWVRLLL